MLIDLRTLVAAWLRDSGHRGDPAATAAVVAAALDGWALHRATDTSVDVAPFRNGLRALVTDTHERSRPT